MASTRAWAARQLRSRRSSREDLIEFTERTFQISGGERYRAGEMHRVIGETLVRAMRTPGSRIILEAPRRHGKSELSTKRFPAFFIGNRPGDQIICCSYGSELASGFGRDVRRIVQAREYQRIFPGVTISSDSAAAGRWHTNKGGIYVAAGVGGPVSGRGADLLLIDDPFKNRLEAESGVVRDSVWDWWRSSAYPTLQPGGSVVVTSSRWHEDDLIGRMIDLQPDRWERISMPALRDGMALDPARYPKDVLEEIRATIGEREWNAQYQQQPTPDEGAFFQRAWLRWYQSREELLKQPIAVYVSSDFALTDKGGDYTVHLVVGVNPGGHWFILDLWRGQVDALEAVDQGLALVRQWNPLIWFCENECRRHRPSAGSRRSRRWRTRQLALDLYKAARRWGCSIFTRPDPSLPIWLVSCCLFRWGGTTIRLIAYRYSDSVSTQSQAQVARAGDHNTRRGRVTQ